MALREYRPGERFPGVIGRTIDESSPAWPAPLRAKPGAPNVLFIVLDDVGFGQLGCYGGLSETPNLDRLAERGVRFNNMHTTALCSPTRACILTGRNSHSNGMAGITEVSTGYPGYNGLIPFANGFLSEMLLPHGYNTFAVGKWHLTPAEQVSAAGPYDRWPLGRGFERFYGFLGGDTHQYYPELVYDNHQVEPPGTPEEGYHLTVDLTDRAIEFIGSAHVVAPDKPFFLYFATGAMHAPHQVPKEWADKYAGRFDMGWEKAREEIFARQKQMGLLPQDAQLPAHDPDVPRWDSLGADEKRLCARMMEVFAGFLEHTDHQIGRLLGYLEQIGELDDTLVMLISDNGASAEGGPTGSINENKFFNFVPEDLEQNLAALPELGGPKYFNHYPWGWTWAGDTPFRRWKRETYRGGVADPFIVSWPKGIAARGEIRHQYAHAIDMVPTVLDCLELEPPHAIRGVTQSPIEGVSFAHALDDGAAPSHHRTQYFEMIGHRALYHDGWRAVCPWPGTSFAEGLPFGTPMSREDLARIDTQGWELYHVAEDPTETRNLADTHRDKLIELITYWYVEAGRYQVLPIDGRGQQRFAEERPQLAPERSRYVYFPHLQSVPENVAVKVLNCAHSITARVTIPTGGAEGVLLCHGGNTGGYTFFVKDGHLHHAHNYVGDRILRVRSDRPVPQGEVELRFTFEPTGPAAMHEGKGTPGIARLFVDGQRVGQADYEVTIPIMIGLGGGLVCGRGSVSPIVDDYRGEFAFTGTLHEVVVEVGGEKPAEDDEAKMRQSLARQ